MEHHLEGQNISRLGDALLEDGYAYTAFGVEERDCLGRVKAVMAVEMFMGVFLAKVLSQFMIEGMEIRRSRMEDSLNVAALTKESTMRLVKTG